MRNISNTFPTLAVSEAVTKKNPVKIKSLKPFLIWLQALAIKVWCQGAESNRRHQHFQCCALPTELPWLLRLSNSRL
jgi:hypothetical protein